MTAPDPQPDTPQTYYIMTSIPYVNGRPHIGFALEAVQSDTLARHHRLLGDDTRFLSGTDENALTVVQAAELAGEDIASLVERNAEAFRGIQDPLEVHYDDFIRTATDPRHFPGAQKLWRKCAEAGDIYKRHYQGQYCIKCERFYRPEELVDGTCPIHGTVPETVDEENYFFRLSAYGDRLRELITSNELLVQPEHRREEMLSFIDSGLEDFSISRRALRGRGWGVPVPDDPEQVMYVWVDALSNYITALDYATDGELYDRYWRNSDQRVHVIGKDIIRFHVIYWPALLLSAGEPLPTTINVHEFLLSDGEKMSKSRGNTVDPLELVKLYGNDALRYWLVREMPRSGDGNFSHDRLIARYNEDLANDLGNLVNRSISMLHRYRKGVVPTVGPREGPLQAVADGLPRRIDDALDRFDFRQAIAAAWELVTTANKYIDDQKPWEIAKAAKKGDAEADARLDVVLADLIETIRLLAVHLTPFIPLGAARIATQTGFTVASDTPEAARDWTDALAGREVPKASPIFPRIEVETEAPEPAAVKSIA
ncbi:MAG TPA: methionine--tRNA ligase [Thermomicrobiales bacterium]|nr:methionine--tRNA ligase [Thermomicrobiales bacterium]